MRIDDLPVFVLTVDLRCRIVNWNKTAAETTGIPNNEALGKGVGDVLGRDVMTPFDHDGTQGNGGIKELCLSAIQGSESFCREFTLKSLNEHQTVLLFNIAASKDGADVNGAIAIGQVWRRNEYAEIKVYNNQYRRAEYFVLKMLMRVTSC